MAEKIDWGFLEKEFNLQNVGEYDTPGKILGALKKSEISKFSITSFNQS